MQLCVFQANDFTSSDFTGCSRGFTPCVVRYTTKRDIYIIFTIKNSTQHSTEFNLMGYRKLPLISPGLIHLRKGF